VRIYDNEMIFFNGPLPGIEVTNGGSGYTSPPAVAIAGGGGSGATADALISGLTDITLDNGGANYTSPPAIDITGGGGSGATAQATIGGGPVTGVTVNAGGSGYTTPPTVVFSGGGGSGATADAVLVGDAVNTINVTDGGSGYTSPPAVSLVGDGTGATASAAIQSSSVTAITLIDRGSGYTSAPTVAFAGGGGAGAAATAVVGSNQVTGITLTNAGDGYVSAPTVVLSGGDGNGATAVQDEMGEAYDRDYGRMSGFLGLELANVSPVNRGFVLYPYIAPPVDMHLDSVTQGAKPKLGDGTQIWKITHNGVDTHTLHFHKYDVQVINSVAWDNQIFPPDPNELGWKETVRIDPLEDTIVAMRPVKPVGLPFPLPNSVRLMDPTKPEGALLPGGPGGYFDPAGDPVTAYGGGGVIANQYVNYGWEFVLHCHLLSHEEMDMMHAMTFVLKPPDISGLSATGTSPAVNLTWTDTSVVESEFVIEWAEAATGPWNILTSVPSDTTAYTDTSIWTGTRYYRVTARNRVGSYVPNFPPMISDANPVVTGPVTSP
jgi:hypothetical protein